MGLMDWNFVFSFIGAISALALLFGGIFAGIIWLIKFVQDPIKKDIDHIKKDLSNHITDTNKKIDKLDNKMDKLETELKAGQSRLEADIKELKDLILKNIKQ